MRVDVAGFNFIKAKEGFRAAPYVDQTGRIWTIGYGHTHGVTATDQSITQEQAEEILRDDLSMYEMTISRRLRIDISQGEFNALVSFAYNLGIERLTNSGIIEKINNGDKLGAAKEFLRYDHYHDKNGNPVEDPGLLSRRKEEMAMFQSDTIAKKNSAEEA